MDKQPVTYISNPFELIRPSFQAFKLVWLKIVLMFLAAVAGGILFVGAIILGGPIGAILSFVLGVLVFYGIGYFGWAITKLTISAAQGRRMSFSEALPKKFSDSWKFLLTSFLVGLVIAGGYLLLIVPGIIFTAWFSLATYVIVEEGVWGTAALRRSRELVRGRTWDLIGTMFLPSSISVITLVPVVGTLVYLVLALILTPVYAVRYVQLIELKKLPDWESTPTSPLNYVAFIIGVIFSGITYTGDFQKSLHDQQQTSSVEKSAQPY